MSERPRTPIEAAIAGTRETLFRQTVTLQQDREAFMKGQARVIENDLFKMWDEIKKLDLKEPIGQIVIVTPDKFVRLFDGTKYAEGNPENLVTLAVNKEDGSYDIDRFPFGESTLTPASPKLIYEYGLWSLNALRKYLEDRAERPVRSQAYYEQLRKDLKERFSGEEYKRWSSGLLPNDLEEGDLLKLRETQALLWLVNNSPADLGRTMEGFHVDLVMESVISGLLHKGFIDHDPQGGWPLFVLTQKGKDYLASKVEA